MKNFDLLKCFSEQQIGHEIEQSAPMRLTGDQIIEALWPLNELFRANLAAIQSLTYDPIFEQGADAAIEAYVFSPNAHGWDALPSGVWRVLLERHMQAMMMASLQMNTPFIPVPEDMPKRAWQGSALLFLHHGMELPFPIQDRTDVELPKPNASASLRRH